MWVELGAIFLANHFSREACCFLFVVTSQDFIQDLFSLCEGRGNLGSLKLKPCV